MASQLGDANLAARYAEFRFAFAQRSLAGKCVLVAGGTGGLGAALVSLLAEEGARLVVGYRSNRARAEALAVAMRTRFQVDLHLVAGDIAEETVRQSLLSAVCATGAPFAGAAVFPGDPARAKLEEVTREGLEESLRANFSGPVLLARDAGRALAAAGGGNLVLLATMQAVTPFAGSLNYAAPKAALIHAARTLAQQWKNVCVNIVAPGATVAGMAAASVGSGKYDSFVTAGTIPRFGRPEDVARAVRFLLEPDGYINGQVLTVDGGLTIRK
jgi:NAD(P)-dependent dehydrogenase (short-subunit alcohol dehydrogenase family)